MGEAANNRIIQEDTSESKDLIQYALYFSSTDLVISYSLHGP